MPGPVNLNQLIYQSPKVEKIHQADHEHPDQMQRQAMVEEMNKTRERSETIQNLDRTPESKIRERKHRDAQEHGSGKKRKSAPRPSAGETGSEDQDNPKAGGIVDLMI